MILNNIWDFIPERNPMGVTSVPTKLHMLHILRYTREHIGERPYKCDLCDYVAASWSTLNYHKLIKRSWYKNIVRSMVWSVYHPEDLSDHEANCVSGRHVISFSSSLDSLSDGKINIGSGITAYGKVDGLTVIWIDIFTFANLLYCTTITTSGYFFCRNYDKLNTHRLISCISFFHYELLLPYCFSQHTHQ